MHGGSQFGRSQAGGQHPGSNYAGSAYGERPQDRAAGQHSAYGGSRYAPSHASDARLSNVPDRSGNDVPLHPLTAHARSVASNQGATSPPYNPTPDQILHAAVRGNAVSPNPSQGYQHSVQSQPWGQPNPHAGISENSRGYSPDMLDEYEQRLVDEVLIRTPRTSYTIAPSALAAEVQNSHFHDGELCLLLHAADDPNSHDVVRRAMRKAIKSRLKKLGLKHDNEAVNSYRLNHTTMHQPAPAPISASPAPVVVHMQQPDDVPPAWARDMFGMLQSTQDHLERLDSKLSSRPGTAVEGIRSRKSSVHELPVTDRDTDSEMRTPKTVTVQIRTAGNNTNRGDSVYRGGDTEGGTIRAPSTRGPTIPGSIHHHDGSQHHDDDEGDSLEYADSHAHRRASQYTPPNQDFEDRSHAGRGEAISGRDDSPGQQYLAEELYKLRIKPTKSERSHNTWEITREEGELADTERVAETESEMIPEIPDTELQHSVYEDQLQPRTSSPAQAALPVTARSQTGHGSVDHAWETNEWSPESESPPPWQRIHQRLLNWAIVWPMSELDQALNSTLRGHQVNEVALSIWATQTYKRYVRSKMMDHPRQTVDRLFVPPNMADAINNAVFNGRHGDACGMLRDLWTPFGLQGMPRLLVVLARHRKEENHWVVHRFSLPDGGLTTFDSFPERALPDGRPLGWWFAIRIAWPHAMYPSPDHLVQKIVRLHRPLQLVIDNSVASAGVWRNALMGSRAERSVDLERLRDLINNEVKNLRQRKEMGKLSITAPRPNWEEIAAS
ncbi:hypothetical protein SISNIDRAFT_404223 [Sistotremastrum niveocremeum HHB9708]|nr:hypothetical protein SISNIDRAFT_404223 [Sistotremastrum niveocremeum HHB9708]